MNSKIVSIIIPVYNSEEFIERCLDSVCSQTYKNLEIICVNDGSTDQSRQIMQRYADIDPRIRIVDKVNGGLPQARRTGFEASTGSYIEFLDSDDWIEPNCVEALLTHIETSGSDIVSCDVWFDYEDGARQSHIQKGEVAEHLSSEEALRALLSRESVFQYAWNKLFKRSAIRSEFFPFVSSMGEDYFTILHILRDGEAAVSHIQQPLHHYVQRSTSMCKKGFTPAHKESFKQFLAEESVTAKQFPNLAEVVATYTSTELLWQLLPMARNNIYDEEIIKEAKSRYRSQYAMLMKAEKLGLSEKGAITLTALSPKLLFLIYRGANRVSLSFKG